MTYPYFVGAGCAGWVIYIIKTVVALQKYVLPFQTLPSFIVLIVLGDNDFLLLLYMIHGFNANFTSTALSYVPIFKIMSVRISHLGEVFLIPINPFKIDKPHKNLNRR